MSFEGILLVAVGAVALVLLLLVVLAWRSATRARHELHVTRAETQALVARLETLERERRLGAAPAPDAGPVIEGRVREEYAAPAAPPVSIDGSIDGRIDGRLFADLVARESLVRAASLAHGVRRALTPENRNRIRFEVRREVKRSRRQRRADLKAALRDQQARERRAMAGEDEDAA